MNIEGLIEKIEQEFDELSRGELTPDSNYKNVIHWSSINVVVLATMVEFEYEVIINAEEFANTNTVSDLYQLIIQKQANQ